MRKSWRLLVVALAAALAVAFSSSNAFANEPGESNSWNAEISNLYPIQSPDTVSQAHDAHGTLIDTWRGYDDQVHIAVNNGPGFTIGTTQTGVAPRVSYFAGLDRFYLFHTGTNGNIYYSYAPSAAAGNAGAWTSWFQLVGNTTNQSVSVASSSNGMMVAYRGSGNNTQLYYAWYDRGSGIWFPAVAMTGGRSNAAPVITYNPVADQFAAAIRGYSDDRIYTSLQNDGSSTWSTWIQAPSITTNSSPVIASTTNGNYLITTRDYNNNVWFQTLDRFGAYGGWQQESQHWQTYVAPFLSVVGGVVYILLTGTTNGGDVYWKQAYTG